MDKMINNSLIFGDIEFGNFGIIEYVRRPYISPITPLTKEILGKDGVIYKSNKLDPLTIEAQIRIFDRCRKNIDKIIHEVMNYLYSQKLRPLNYKNKRVWYDAILIDVGDPQKFRNEIAYLELTFLVPSGDGRSEYRRDDFKQITEKKISMSTPRSTRPIFKFNGTQNKITNMMTGEFIMIESPTTYNFVIDCEKETVKEKDLNLIKYLNWKSDFFDIKDGDIIKSTNPIDIEFFERYLYDT